MDDKTKILIGLLFLMLTSTLVNLSYAHFTASNIQIVYESESTLIFQHGIEQNVTFQILSGSLNTTTNTLGIYVESGAFTFTAINDTTLKINHTFTHFTVRGDKGNGNRMLHSGETIAIDKGDTVIMEWLMLIEPWLPIMFIFGMIGITASIGGPVYAYYKIKDGHYYEGFRMGLLLTVAGMALTMGWLWA